MIFRLQWPSGFSPVRDRQPRDSLSTSNPSRNPVLPFTLFWAASGLRGQLTHFVESGRKMLAQIRPRIREPGHERMTECDHANLCQQ